MHGAQGGSLATYHHELDDLDGGHGHDGFGKALRIVAGPRSIEIGVRIHELVQRLPTARSFVRRGENASATARTQPRRARNPDVRARGAWAICPRGRASAGRKRAAGRAGGRPHPSRRTAWCWCYVRRGVGVFGRPGGFNGGALSEDWFSFFGGSSGLICLYVTSTCCSKTPP